MNLDRLAKDEVNGRRASHLCVRTVFEHVWGSINGVLMKESIGKITTIVMTFVAIAGAATAQSSGCSGHWVSAWSTAVQAPRKAPGLPPPLTIDNQTIRMIVRPTIEGQKLRVRLSNELGKTPLSLGSVHVAIIKQDGEIVTKSDHTLTFSGNAAVNIPAGSPMLSDPLDLHVHALEEIAVTLYVPKESVPTTFHLLGQHDTYISGQGDFGGATVIPDAKVTKSWYWLSGVEFWVTNQSAAIVALGDSITDGFGAKAKYADWPNQLAERLLAQKGMPELAVDNEGIGGNRILHDGAGISTLARFDRDVLSRPGVLDLIILEGINDIGWPHMKPRPAPDGTVRQNPWKDQMVTADDLIEGMKQIIERAHEHGIRVFGATMTPYGGNIGTFTADGEAVRQAVNQWIRTSGLFDGVFDFDAAVRDPQQPDRFRDNLQTGDYLHPNAAGYKAMAAAIDLAALRSDGRKVSKNVPDRTKE